MFGQTVRHEFVNFDDDLYVYDAPNIKAGLTINGILLAFTSPHARNWHPLTTISHMLDCQLWGLDAGGHHVTNLFLHTIAVLLLFTVLRQMTGALWKSALVAALFAIHPLHVESVAWVSERKDVLSALFFFLMLGAYVRYARAPQYGYLLVIVLFAAGLMSKPMLVSAPLILLLLDYWPLDRIGSRTSESSLSGNRRWEVKNALVRSQSSHSRKDPAASSLGVHVCDHVCGAKTRYRCDTAITISLAYGKCGGELRDLHLANIVAHTARRFLSPSK